MSSRSYLELTLIAALVGLSAPAMAAPPRVGVVVSTGVNLTEEARVDLSARVGEALSRELVVDVTAGREVARRLEPNAPGPECYLDRTCQAGVAARLDVEQLLVLLATRIGTRLQIEPTWIEVASGRAVVRDAIVTDSVKEDLSEALRAAASRLLPEAELRPRPEAAPAPAVVTSVPSTATATVARPSGPPLASWVALGAGGVALAVGVGFGISAKQGYDDLEADGCGVVRCADDRIDAVDDRALVADVMYGVAGAAVVTGLVLWWLDAPAPVTVGAAPTPNGGSVAFVGGRF